MKEFLYKITDEVGIHARPAGLLVKKASEFNSDIKIVCGEKSADAKKIFAVMALGAKCGNEVRVTADGFDEDTAIGEMEKFFKENL